MSAYYNEIDPAAAQWLRNLIAAGLIPAGDVDERSIEDVRPIDLRGYRQCHFFAGVGGWAHALALAGWPPDKSCWTGSCPCQPFSSAGAGAGFADERHLWPAWYHLISQCRPDVIFGEQVAAAVGHDWLDLVSADLEGQGYRVGAAVLGAHSVGAPHIRQRLWFVADANSGGRAPGVERREAVGYGPTAESDCGAGKLGDSDNARLEGRWISAERAGKQPARSPSLADHWNAEWIPCRDGKARPVEPGSFPLAHGIPARVVRLRAYGNAIVPQVAAEFIRAYLGVTS